MPDTWRPVRPYTSWPRLESRAFDPRAGTYVPNASIGDEQINRLSPRKMRLLGIRIYSSANRTIATGTDTTVTFDTVDYSQGFIRPAGATFTTFSIPYDGVYILVADVEWASDDADRSMWFYINSVKKEGDTRSSGTTAIVSRASLSTLREMVAGDTVGLRVNQNGAANLDITGGAANCVLAANYLGAI